MLRNYNINSIQCNILLQILYITDLDLHNESKSMNPDRVSQSHDRYYESISSFKNYALETPHWSSGSGLSTKPWVCPPTLVFPFLGLHSRTSSFHFPYPLVHTWPAKVHFSWWLSFLHLLLLCVLEWWCWEFCLVSIERRRTLISRAMLMNKKFVLRFRSSVPFLRFFFVISSELVLQFF